MPGLRTTTYWKANCLGDSNAYSLRGRTKKELLARLEKAGLTRGTHPDHGQCWVDPETLTARYENPTKVTVDYDGQMDLIEQLLGEGNGQF